MAGRVLIGVDLGTSSVKGAAFDPEGRCLAVAETASGYDVPAPGWAEADADAWWLPCATCCGARGRGRARAIAASR